MQDMVFLEESHWYKVWDIVNFFTTNPVPRACIWTKILSIYEYKWELWFSLETPKSLKWSYRDRRLSEADLEEIKN